MAASKNAIFGEHPVNNALIFTQADGTNPKILITSASDATLWLSGNAKSTDITDRIAVLTLTNDINTAEIGEINIPALSGVGGISTLATVNLMDPDILKGVFQNDGSYPLQTDPTNPYRVEMHMKVPVTAALQIDVTIVGGDY